MGDLVERLRAAGCVFAEEEAALLAEATPDRQRLERMVADRVAGLPLEQILGWADFAGVRVAVEPGVFVPRQRTALLVDLATAAARDGDVVVDLCCGTGGLGAALLARRPGIDLHAADLDPAAVACARRNLPPERVHEGDLYGALPGDLRGRVDVLMVNAPYVPTDEIAHLPPEARDHEHRLALDGGGDGLDVHRRVAEHAAEWMADHGMLLIEVSTAQAPVAVTLLAAAGLVPDVVAEPERGATVVRGSLS